MDGFGGGTQSAIWQDAMMGMWGYNKKLAIQQIKCSNHYIVIYNKGRKYGWQY